MSERQGGAPLGIVLTPSGADVGVYAAHASAAYLCLYDEAGEHGTGRLRLTPDDHGVHRGQAADLRAGTRYGFRVDGPFQPSQGHRFDISKLLADPYAAAIDRPWRLHPSMFAHGADSGPFAPETHCASSATASKPKQSRLSRSRRPLVWIASLGSR